MGRVGAAAVAAEHEVWPDAEELPAGPRSDRLSDKERTVFRELARGTSTEEIAGILMVSPHTVRTHVKNGMRKLDARTRAHAVAIALSEGAIEM
jgi:DNA-binding CsgD family transcriptional regulator